jgi:hypothetical protein
MWSTKKKRKYGSNFFFEWGSVPKDRDVALKVSRGVTKYIEYPRRKENYNPVLQIDTKDPRSKTGKAIRPAPSPPSSPSFQPRSTTTTPGTWPLGSQRREPIALELKGLHDITWRLKKTLHQRVVASLEEGSSRPSAIEVVGRPAHGRREAGENTLPARSLRGSPFDQKKQRQGATRRRKSTVEDLSKKTTSPDPRPVERSKILPHHPRCPHPLRPTRKTRAEIHITTTEPLPSGFI